jgi:hypothetical protein
MRSFWRILISLIPHRFAKLLLTKQPWFVSCYAYLWLLTVGAEIAAAVSDGKALDGYTTNRAWLAAAVSHTEVGMGSAKLTVWSFIGVNAGALTIDCRP